MLVFTLSSGIVQSQESGSLSYEGLPELVKSNNQSVKSARLMVKASEKRTGHLLRSFLPTIKASVGYENYSTINLENRSDPYGGIEGSINIFKFGRDNLEEKIRDAKLKKSKASSQINYNLQLYEARKIYWKIVYQNEIIKILEMALNKNKKLLESANRRIKRGITTKTDRLEFDLYALDLNTNIESLRHENKILKIALGRYLGKDIGDLAVRIYSIPHDHDEVLLSESFNKEHNSSVKLTKASSELLDFQSKKANRWWTPSVDVYGGYGLYTVRQRDFLDRADRDDTWVGVRLTMNIFDGDRSNSEARFLEAKASSIKEKLNYLFNEKEAEFKIIQEEMKHAHELTHVSEDKMKKGNTYFVRTIREYDKGVKNSLDALSSLQRIVSFKVEYAKIRLDYQNKKMALQKMKGI